MSELKPCPFCGASVNRVSCVYGLNFFKCTNKDCGSVTSFDNDYYNTHTDEAVAAWNRRANNELL